MDTGQLFLDRSRSFLGEEYRIKLRRAVEALPDDALWWRPNDQANSVGNLLLHLAGNVRQWIVCGIGGAPDVRDRAGEFAARQGASAEQLLSRLERVLQEADVVLARLDPDDLTARRTIQGREVSILDAIFQVVQHFALHLGQIILVAKERVPGAIQFYEDAGGQARPIWKEMGSGTAAR